MGILIFSGLLLLIPLGASVYHVFKKPEDFGAAMTLWTLSIPSGFLFAGIEAGYWVLIFLQVVLVGPLTIWTFRKRPVSPTGRSA